MKQTLRWNRGPHRLLRRLQGRRRPELLRRAGRTALRDRPQRRRQDHAAGHDLRQDQADRGHDPVQELRADRHDRVPDHPRRRRAQVPEPVGVRGPHGVSRTSRSPSRSSAASSARCSSGATRRLLDKIDTVAEQIFLRDAARHKAGLLSPRPEAVARDRHAAHAGSGTAAARRAGGRHERARARADRGAAERHLARAARSW